MIPSYNVKVCSPLYNTLKETRQVVSPKLSLLKSSNCRSLLKDFDLTIGLKGTLLFMLLKYYSSMIIIIIIIICILHWWLLVWRSFFGLAEQIGRIMFFHTVHLAVENSFRSKSKALLDLIREHFQTWHENSFRSARELF